jgi:outer membrane protein assembly factor BamB
MKIQRLNSKTTVTFILIFAIAFSLITFFPVAHASDNIETVAYLSVEPNPVGVGQQVSINVWILPAPPTPADTYHGLFVQITDPNGNNNIQTLPVTSTQGTQSFSYIPDKIGVWNFQLGYPGETIRNFNIKPSQSLKTTLTVQQQQIQPSPEYPLPVAVENWTFPVSGTNRLWSSITGNWLMRGYNASYSSLNDVVAAYNPYSTAPKSAHIVWIKPLSIGGLVGGEYGNLSYYSGLPNEDKLEPPIVMEGKVYYNMFISQNSYVLPGFVCLDLRTGKELWRQNNTQVTCGQLFDFESSAQTGIVGPYLWSTATSSYNLYDADTGNLILTFTNAVPSGPGTPNPIVFGNDGTMYIYMLDTSSRQLSMWNSTLAFQANGMIPIDPSSGAALWRPAAGTYDWRKGIQWTTQEPAQPSPTTSAGFIPEAIKAVSNGIIIAIGGAANNYATHTGYNATTGKQIWTFNRTPTGAHQFTTNMAFGEGIYTQFDAATRTYFAYNIYNGNQLWQSDQANYPWGAFSGGSVIVYDKLYTTSSDGHVYAFAINNGTLVWGFYCGNTTETPCGTYPFRYGPIIADGVVYAGTGEQVPHQPLYKGDHLFAIDAISGKSLWNISGIMNLNAIANGYLLMYNAADNQIYCFGRGETTTTISLSSNVISNGTSIFIQGTAVDNSPAQPGTPCTNSDYMAGWLQYLHMQQPCPYATIPGVRVELRALLSNGTLVELGLPTSDEYGRYNFEWTPPSPGVYRIIARFPGDASYFVTFNWAESDLTVTAASVAEKEAPAYTTVDLVIIAAVAVAIILVLYNIVEVRRRHK